MMVLITLLTMNQAADGVQTLMIVPYMEFISDMFHILTEKSPKRSRCILKSQILILE